MKGRRRRSRSVATSTTTTIIQQFLVVLPALRGIAQDFVRFIDVPELDRGRFFLVGRIPVRVILQRQFAISLFNVLQGGGGGWLQAQDLVVRWLLCLLLLLWLRHGGTSEQEEDRTDKNKKESLLPRKIGEGSWVAIWLVAFADCVDNMSSMVLQS